MRDVLEIGENNVGNYSYTYLSKVIPKKGDTFDKVGKYMYQIDEAVGKYQTSLMSIIFCGTKFINFGQSLSYAEYGNFLSPYSDAKAGIEFASKIFNVLSDGKAISHSKKDVDDFFTFLKKKRMKYLVIDMIDIVAMDIDVIMETKKANREIVEFTRYAMKFCKKIQKLNDNKLFNLLTDTFAQDEINFRIKYK